jgi:hypothetical protein
MLVRAKDKHCLIDIMILSLLTFCKGKLRPKEMKKFYLIVRANSKGETKK